MFYRYKGASMVQSNADGSAQVIAASKDLQASIEKFDLQLQALNKQLSGLNSQLNAKNAELGQIIQDRSSCDFDTKQIVAANLLPGSQIYFTAEQNKCLDDNNGRQANKRIEIQAIQTQIDSVKSQIKNVSLLKEKAIVDLREQIKAESIAETERIKAQAGMIVAQGQVDPDVIKAKTELESESQMAANKKILYAGVVIFIVIASLALMYVVVTKKSSI